MTDYRLYLLDKAGKIQSAEWISAAGDPEAVEQARALMKPVTCELWDRNRFVGRVEAHRSGPA